LVLRENTCPKCGGNMRLEENEYHERYWHCLECGKDLHLPPEPIKHNNIPPKPVTKDARMLSKYYDDNKTAILTDLEEMGLKAMRRKWGIPRTTWLCRGKKSKGLFLRWGVKESPSTKHKPAQAVILLKLGSDIQTTISDVDLAALTPQENNGLWLLIGRMQRNKGLRKLGAV